MGILNISNAPLNSGNIDKDSIRINKSVGRITATVSLFRFKDKDTNQFIIFCPSFDLTGYGETSDKATEMVKFSIQNYFDYLIECSTKQIEIELRNLGWKHDRFSTKGYSKAYVDIDGELKNFNALDNKVERLVLEAA